ncbi:MAG: transcriptional regulator [Dehalococcoidia bacterium]|nr:transcriptional regulator [Dehalococcoidia bacterium]
MRRNDLDICADILRATRNGAKKTHIVYKANLNFNMIKRYLKRLMGGSLLTLADGHYTATDRGLSWLSRYEDLHYVSALSPEAAAIVV